MKYGEGSHCGLGACQARSFPAAPAPCSGQGWEQEERRREVKPQSWPKPANTSVRDHLQRA